MRYFDSCETLDQVKALYRKLALLNHPDKGGNLQVMQAINAEYPIACSRVIRSQKAAGFRKYAEYTEKDINDEILNAGRYREALEKIINIEDITVELCGTWIWVTGEYLQTRVDDRKVLKDAGFFFAFKKLAWYFRTPENRTKNRKAMPLEAIREKYGSKNLKGRHFTPRLADDQE